MISNPILPGFHPDPCVLRVGAEYYLATSTFEWYPGVRLYHSRDLANWRSLGGALHDPGMLAGVRDSGGIWAPDLSYSGGLFHLVYGIVDSYAGGYCDVSNYLVTSASIDGPWSAPVRLPGRGFDVSLFHDEETGQTWMLSMLFDTRPGHGFSGIELQPLSAGRPAGKPRLIFAGTSTGVTEGPRLYRIGGWYYLMTAEGGTGYEHGITVSRSRSLFGPYQPDPAGPMLTARHDPALELQKAGHGCLVQTPAGQWYMTYLAARPYTTRGRCVLGRETALTPVEWSADGWPRVPGGIPAVEVPALEGGGVGNEGWSTLRRPADPGWVTSGPGWLRIYGGQSPHGLRAPSLVARPVVSAHDKLEAILEFEPLSQHCSAGITLYYNTRNWHYLSVTADGLTVLSSDRGIRTAYPAVPVPGRVGLRAELDGPVLRFGYDAGSGWRTLPYALDATVASDENATEISGGQVSCYGFTGAMFGLWVQDLAAEGASARFSTQAELA